MHFFCKKMATTVTLHTRSISKVMKVANIEQIVSLSQDDAELNEVTTAGMNAACAGDNGGRLYPERWQPTHRQSIPPLYAIPRHTPNL